MRRTVLTAALFLLWLSPAQAQILFSLNPANKSGQPGNSVTFNATLTNAGSATVWLNGANSSGLVPGLTVDANPFFDNFPLFLIGGDAATADLFNVAMDSSVAPGDYFGSFTVLGGADDAAQNILATQNFQVTVQAPAAEPGSGAALFVGIASICLSAWRRSRAS